MRTFLTIVGVFFAGVSSIFAATNGVPTTNSVLRYERAQPVFRSTVIPPERGNRLLTILQDAKSFVSWGEAVRKSYGTNLIGCVLPVPAETWVTVRLTNGTSYKVGISRDGGLVALPAGLFQAEQSARSELRRLAADLSHDLRQEVVNAQKPLTYKVGTIDDGWTLSGIARVFYGDASKWQKIYEANRSVMKNPNLIDGRMKLVIPKLE